MQLSSDSHGWPSYIYVGWPSFNNHFTSPQLRFDQRGKELWQIDYKVTSSLSQPLIDNNGLAWHAFLLRLKYQEILFNMRRLRENNCSKKRGNQGEEAASAGEGFSFELLQVWGKSSVELLEDDIDPVQDCGLVLETGVRGKECWPIRSHTLCYRSELY